MKSTAKHMNSSNKPCSAFTSCITAKNGRVAFLGGKKFFIRKDLRMPGTLGSGPALLSEALSMEPLLQLTFYRAGIILRKPTENGAFTEYPVNPDDIAKALSKPVVFSTGLITLNTIFVQTDGLTTTVAEYRPPQVTVMRL